MRCKSEQEREKERERERERQRQTKAMSPLPPLSRWSWRRDYIFPCQKFAPSVSPFALFISPFTNGHHSGASAEIRNEHTLFIAKNSHSLFRLKWRDVWSRNQDQWPNIFLPCPKLFFPPTALLHLRVSIEHRLPRSFIESLPIKMNKILTKHYWKYEKRSCVRRSRW